jgi:hypothetical protein
MIRQVSYSLILARSGRGLLPASIRVRLFTDSHDDFKPKKTEVASGECCVVNVDDSWL